MTNDIDNFYRADCVEYFGTPVPAIIAVGGA